MSLPRTLVTVVLAALAVLLAVSVGPTELGSAGTAAVHSSLAPAYSSAGPVLTDPAAFVAGLQARDEPSPGRGESPRPPRPSAILVVLIMLLAALAAARWPGDDVVIPAPGRRIPGRTQPGGTGPSWGAMPGLLRV